MEETQAVIKMPQEEFKIDSVPNNVSGESEEVIEYCLEAATNITQQVKNDGDHDTDHDDEGNEKVLTTLETIQTNNQEDEETY